MFEVLQLREIAGRLCDRWIRFGSLLSVRMCSLLPLDEGLCNGRLAGHLELRVAVARDLRYALHCREWFGQVQGTVCWRYRGVVWIGFGDGQSLASAVPTLEVPQLHSR